MGNKVIDIEELHQDSKNFNKGTADGQRLMEKSFSELGAGRSILLDKSGNIIAGNKSQLAAIAAGIKKVRVIETDGSELVAVKRVDVDIDSLKGRELALADNLTQQVNLSWDKDMVGDVAGDFGIDLDDWGWNSDADEEEPEVLEDDFDEKNDAVESVVKSGDIWMLGDHRLMCGDSTRPEEIKKLMGPELAHLWLTDPPYNVKVKNSKGLKIQNDDMKDDQFRKFLYEAFFAANEVLADGSPFYVWFASKEHINFEGALKDNGLAVRQELIWNKNSFILGRSHYHWKHEPCLYGWKGDRCRYFISKRNRKTVLEEYSTPDIDKMKTHEMRDLLHQIYESHEPLDVFNIPKPAKDSDHPTMKPVRLFGQQVINSSKEGDIVLDTFGGSGTTIIACEQLGRKARLMELDPHYCDVIIARWEKFTGRKAVRIENL